MVTTINGLLEKMWVDYTTMNPQAKKVYDTLTGEGEKVLNDHIALRTFNDPRVCVDVLAKPILSAGYKEAGKYDFEQKKLKAKHFHHPDENMPKIFISELELQYFSPDFQAEVKKLVDQVKPSDIARFDFMSMGRPWNVSSSTYEKLQKESDYAAWVAAIGYRPNHFTVYINHLKKFNDIKVLNSFLKSKGFKLNDSGGEIKGTPAELLEQSSTLADTVEVEFSDKKIKIPSCYYEFAKRYPGADGKLYQGFIAKSADKIFESTNKGQ
jgi:hypothetical protein